jgi:hypothetical protein
MAEKDQVTYSIPDPTGAVQSITGPPGQSRAQVIAKIKERQQAAKLKEMPDAPMLDEAVAEKRAEAVTGAKRGLIGGLGMLGDVESWIDRKLGTQGAGPTAPTSEEVAKRLSPIMTPPKEGEPSSTFTEFAANPLSWMGPGGFMTKLLSILGGSVGHDVGGTVAGMPGEIIGTVLGGGLTPKGIGKVVTPTREISENRLAMADFLEKEGIETRAGQVSGSPVLKRGEEVLGSAPLSGDKAGEQFNRQMGQFTSAAMRRVGMNDSIVTPQVVDKMFTTIGAEFDRLEHNFLEVNQTFKDEVRQAAKDYWNLTEPGKRNEFIARLDDQIQRWPTSIAMQGPLYKMLRSQLNKYARGADSPAYREALTDMQNALDNAMESTLKKYNPADVGKWQEARSRYRNALVIEKAITGGQATTAEGFITPAKLYSAAESVGKRYFRRGKDDFSELSHAGKTLLTPPKSSGTTENLLVSGIPAALGAAGTLAVTGNIPGAIAATTAAAGPGLAGRAILTKPAQAWLKNQLAIEYLKQQSPATLSGIRTLLSNLGTYNPNANASQ